MTHLSDYDATNSTMAEYITKTTIRVGQWMQVSLSRPNDEFIYPTELFTLGVGRKPRFRVCHWC